MFKIYNFRLVRLIKMKDFKIEFSDKEQKRMKRFEEDHRHPDMTPATAGGKFVYSFNPTGIGIFINIKCLACNKEKDITDMEHW